MAEYPPPTDNFPIFDALAFTVPLTATITLAEANAKYLARTETAISIAQTTSFTDNITIGNSILDYIPGQGMQIKSTANSQALFLRVLDGTGATKQRIECNETHQHLYDQTRITESATPTNYTSLQQTGVALDMYNTTTSGTMTFRTETSGSVATTPLSLSSTSIEITPSQVATGLNGLVVNSAMFGRDDTGANTFNGSLSYSRHPIGWTISANKNIAIPTSATPIDPITQGTAITVFNNLSNGVWRIGCICNNAPVLGNMSFVELRWTAPTGATVLNAAIGQMFHQISPAGALVNFSNSYPDLFIRTTGNGTTALGCYFACTYSVQPTIQFNFWAIKVA